MKRVLMAVAMATTTAASAATGVSLAAARLRGGSDTFNPYEPAHYGADLGDSAGAAGPRPAEPPECSERKTELIFQFRDAALAWTRRGSALETNAAQEAPHQPESAEKVTEGAEVAEGAEDLEGDDAQSNASDNPAMLSTAG